MNSEVSSRNLKEFEPVLEQARLNIADTPWLEALRGETVDKAWIAETNQAVVTGSVDLRSTVSDEIKDRILAARETFYGQQLGWANDSHVLHDMYTNLANTYNRSNGSILPVPSTTVGTLRILYVVGIDTLRVIEQAPAILWLEPESVKAKLDTLQEQGINAVAVINKQPTLIHLSSENIIDKVNNFQSWGIDPAKAINRMPNILFLATDSVNHKIINIQLLGINAVAGINFMPQMLALGLDSIKDKMLNLEQLGFDASAVINKAPQVLKYAPESLVKRVHKIERVVRLLGWNAPTSELIEYFPPIFGYSDKKLIIHARLLARYGRADMSAKEVAAHIINPLEAHIIALDKHGEYSASTVSSVQKKTKSPERKAHVERLLAEKRDRLVSLMGEQTVQAYEKYATKGVKV